MAEARALARVIAASLDPNDFWKTDSVKGPTPHEPPLWDVYIIDHEDYGTIYFKVHVHAPTGTLTILSCHPPEKREVAVLADGRKINL